MAEAAVNSKTFANDQSERGENMVKKCISLLMLAVMLACLMLPAMAAQEPVITRQVQNPVFPKYAHAEYSVTVNGKNLRCTWYLKFEGKTYNICDTEGAAKPWEVYAGETYGPKESKNGDFTTFSYFFGGIELSLDGAILYPVIEDGHFEITGDSAVIQVAEGVEMPPKIMVASGMEIFQGDPLDLYCEASSDSGSALSYVWYESSSGKLQDIVAINKGAETSDTLHCDTSKLGTRYYVCLVATADGGSGYSSVIPVTVISNKSIEPPTIKTTSIPSAKAGKDYSFQLECSDPDAVFDIYYDPGKPNDFESTGLTLTKKGELKGRPQTLGMFYFTVSASNDGGEGYQRLCLTVEDGAEAKLEIVKVPDKVEYYSGEKLDMTGLKVLIHENGKTVESLNGDKLTYTDKALVTLGEQKIKLTYKDAFEIFIVTVKEAPEELTTEAMEPTETEPETTELTEPETTEATEPPIATPDEPEIPEKNTGMPWWGILLITLAASGLGCGATFLVLKKKSS